MWGYGLVHKASGTVHEGEMAIGDKCGTVRTAKRDGRHLLRTFVDDRPYGRAFWTDHEGNEGYIDRRLPDSCFGPDDSDGFLLKRTVRGMLITGEIQPSVWAPKSSDDGAEPSNEVIDPLYKRWPNGDCVVQRWQGDVLDHVFKLVIAPSPEFPHGATIEDCKWRIRECASADADPYDRYTYVPDDVRSAQFDLMARYVRSPHNGLSPRERQAFEAAIEQALADAALP
jgi:hypothetical protein